ncbi:MAG: hypothetical protein ACK53L_32765, partial [Pirellulaceae bacterium]
SHVWRVQLPVFAKERSLGRMTLAGRMENVDAVSILNELVEMVEGLQPEILQLASESLQISILPTPDVGAEGAVPSGKSEQPLSGLVS